MQTGPISHVRVHMWRKNMHQSCNEVLWGIRSVPKFARNLFRFSWRFGKVFCALDTECASRKVKCPNYACKGVNVKQKYVLVIRWGTTRYQIGAKLCKGLIPRFLKVLTKFHVHWYGMCARECQTSQFFLYRCICERKICIGHSMWYLKVGIGDTLHVLFYNFKGFFKVSCPSDTKHAGRRFKLPNFACMGAHVKKKYASVVAWDTAKYQLVP